MAKEFHRLISLTAFLFFICAPYVLSAEIHTGQPLIIIDPGHDDATPGLESNSGDNEAAITLELARQLATQLSDNCRIRLTRTSENRPLESERIETANHEKADLFISLHLHGPASFQPLIYFFDIPEASDTETWQTRALRSRDLSKKLAETLAAALKDKEPQSRPLILSGPVLPLEGMNMPGILIEPFALSQIPKNPDKRASFLAEQVTPIATALLAFLSDPQRSQK